MSFQAMFFPFLRDFLSLLKLAQVIVSVFQNSFSFSHLIPYVLQDSWQVGLSQEAFPALPRQKQQSLL